MNAHLNYIVAQQHIADLHRAAERARLARDAGTEPRDSRVWTPVTRLSAQLARLTARLTPTGDEVRTTRLELCLPTTQSST